MKQQSFKAPIPPVRSTWNSTQLMVGKLLTDAKIEKYRRLGWYSPEYRQARRDLQAKRKAEREKREGNFTERDGRLIYSPI